MRAKERFMKGPTFWGLEPRKIALSERHFTGLFGLRSRAVPNELVVGAEVTLFRCMTVMAEWDLDLVPYHKL